MYRHCLKRVFDFILSLIGLVLLSWLFAILIILGTIFMCGNPFFTQERPGKNEKIFKLVKFRTMDNRKDEHGDLLPDAVRLNKYGSLLRSTSLDELPELINILKGEMAIVGPRPQLVRDMVFMTKAQRKRHDVRPGLTGLAQVKGRNAITWEEKLSFDLEYIGNISLNEDVKIILTTVKQIFKREGITENGMATATDYGDYLLAMGKVDKRTYQTLLGEAKKMIEDNK